MKLGEEAIFDLCARDRTVAPVILVVAEGQVICGHRRIIDRSHDRPGQAIYDWRYYLAVVQRKPGALRNGAPFLERTCACRWSTGKTNSMRRIIRS